MRLLTVQHALNNRAPPFANRHVRTKCGTAGTRVRGHGSSDGDASLSSWSREALRWVRLRLLTLPNAFLCLSRSSVVLPAEPVDQR